MKAERWDRVKQIVADALEMERAVRGPFVEQACGTDAGLRREVETLLGADDPDSGFLNMESVPRRLGPYRIVREIGRGGMGTVYLAERDDGQFEQRVAIKVIKRGMDTDAVLRRFYAERQILARLQHPHITRLLDGGMYEGRPYFVMEHLEGDPLIEYCRRRHLPIADRIHLFQAVCDAVEHAHRNLILHRDIKAGNILVDRTGTVKLLDFGIAKLLEEDGAAEQTAIAARVLTPQAASPEQIRGEPLTTASDVYALGVLLFELLAGKPPYKVQAGTQSEMLRTVCEQAPPRPSAVADSAEARQLRGDLDNIVLKAMEKEPALRYQRAADLAGDLQRYVAGLPVEARPAGALYRARKFVRRNRRALAVALVVLLAIGAALADAIRQERRASRRFEDLRQLAGTFLFEFHDAIATLPGSTPACELVEKRALQYLDNLARESSRDFDLKRELAEGYARIGDAQGLYFESNLGKTAEARSSYEKAIALLEEVLRARPADLKATNDLARALFRLATTYQASDPAKGETFVKRAVAMLEEEAKHRTLDAAAQTNLGVAYFGISEHEMSLGHIRTALAARLRSIAILQDVTTRNPQDWLALRSLAQSENRLAYIYLVHLHDPGKAAQPLQQSVAIDEMLLARDPSSTVARLELALTRDYLGTVLWRQGDREKGLRLLESAISARAEVWSADPKNVRVRFLLVGNYAKLGSWLGQEKRPAEARTAYLKGLQVAGDGNSANVDPELAAGIAALRKGLAALP